MVDGWLRNLIELYAYRFVVESDRLSSSKLDYASKPVHLQLAL